MTDQKRLPDERRRRRALRRAWIRVVARPLEATLWIPASIVIVILLFGGGLAADSWPGPHVMTSFSADGHRFVRISPGQSVGDVVGFAGEAKGAYARALFYERRPDRSYRVAADVALLNPVAPVDILLSNSGYLITFDNWHNLGYGESVAIYNPTGAVVASWELEQLYTPEQLGGIRTSVSSRWWRCRPFHFVDLEEQTKVYVREALGGYFVFQLAEGKFTHTKGDAECTPAARPLSASYHP
jgi:hypothetical protein